MLRPFGPRRLVRSLLLGEDADAASTKPKAPSSNGQTDLHGEQPVSQRTPSAVR